MATATASPVCDSCIEAVFDEGPVQEREDAIVLARDFGADIADHICEGREAGEPCGCACRRR